MTKNQLHDLVGCAASKTARDHSDNGNDLVSENELRLSVYCLAEVVVVGRFELVTPCITKSRAGMEKGGQHGGTKSANCNDRITLLEAVFDILVRNICML